MTRGAGAPAALRALSNLGVATPAVFEKEFVGLSGDLVEVRRCIGGWKVGTWSAVLSTLVGLCMSQV